MRAAAVPAIVFALVVPFTSFAQQPPQPPQPAQPARPAAPAPAPAPRAPQAPRPVTAPTPAPAPATPQAPPAPAPYLPVPVTIDPMPGQLVNIQIDITLMVEGGSEGGARKVLTLTLADRQEGSVRSTDRNPGVAGAATLNLDARPIVQPNGRVLTRIGLEFQSGNDVPFVQVRAQPLLESGKALRISRAVSPKGDRAVTVEVTATVLK